MFPVKNTSAHQVRVKATVDKRPWGCANTFCYVLQIQGGQCGVRKEGLQQRCRLTAGAYLDLIDKR